MIFSRCTHHRRTADIDVLNGVFQATVGICCNRFKWIQVDDHEIDGRDILRLHDSLVLQTAQNSAMNTRVQRFDTAIHNFGKPGKIAYTGYRKTLPGQ